MTFLQKLNSRKLWVAALSLAALALMAATGQLPVQQAVTMAGNVVLTYLAAQGVVDAFAGKQPIQ